MIPNLLAAAAVLSMGAAITAAAAQEAPAEAPAWTKQFPDWVEPVEPFQIEGPIHYVGTKGLGAYLITTDEGHILLDGAGPGYEDLVVENIETLGYSIADVKILLNSHAHYDHSGGLAKLKELSSAQLFAMKEDVDQLERGVYAGSEDDESLMAPPVKVDGLLFHRDTVAYGGIQMVGWLTPGHSPGCTSWWMTVGEGETAKEVLFFCSASVAANSLVPEQYPGIVADYQTTFEMTKDWQPDIFLANHPFYSDLWTARERQLAGEEDPFADNGQFQKMIRGLEASFEMALTAQQARAAKE